VVHYQPAEELKSNVLSYSRKPFSMRIAWLFPQADLAINPSNRLRRYQISQYLSELFGSIVSNNFFCYGSKPYILNELMTYDVIVLFSINEQDKELCRILKANNKIVIFDHCENIFSLGHEDDIMENCTAITCCSMALADLTDKYLNGRGKDKPIFVIRDPIDDAALNLPLPRNTSKLDNDIALVMGMGANVQYVLPFLEKVCEQQNYRITVISESIPVSSKHIFKIWTPYSWVEEARSCSVALCYHDKDRFPAKGNVKVTMPMALGLPVIAVPILSYQEAVTNGVEGFIASTQEEWMEALYKLKDPYLRMNMALLAREKALLNYGTEKIGLDYLFMLNYLRGMQET
jgi:glycosyltransferase involved in cell wall biosynthesis